MSLPETIWWCEQHDDQQYGDKIHYCGINWDGGAAAPCRMVEVELHPVGSRVARPDDLVIRASDEPTHQEVRARADRWYWAAAEGTTNQYQSDTELVVAEGGEE